MKQGFLLLVLVVLLLPVCLAGAADESVIPDQASTQLPPTKEYLIGIPAPREPLDISADLRNAPPDRLLRETAERQAGPLLAELSRLARRGEILTYELDPAQFAVRVTTTGDLPPVGDAAAYAVEAGASPPTCAAGLPEAMVETARSIANANAIQPLMTRAATDGPTINVQVRAPYVGEYPYISGNTEPDVPIEMRVWRNGSLYLEWYNWSQSDGYYQMYPYLEDCPKSGYVWDILPGDVVEIEAAGQTSRTTVVPVVASLNPVTGQIEGQTAPNREIRGWLNFMEAASCYWDSEAWYSESGVDGRFTEDLSNIAELDRSSDAIVYVLDANGHMTYTWFNSFSIETEAGYNGAWMMVNRGASGVAQLKRGGQTIDQTSFVADARGNASVYFYNADILPGDVITVQDGKITVSTTIAHTDFSLDASQNRLIGTTTPGRKVLANFSGRDNPYDAVQTTCEWKYDCQAVVAPASGLVSMPAQFDVLPGDYIYVIIYDAEGNQHYVPTMSAPTLATGPGLYNVRGYWALPYTEVDVRLYANDNSLKAETTDYSGYEGELYVWFGEPALVGDRVEVTDGVRTLSMVIPDVSGRLNSVTDFLRITGPDRPYLAYYEDLDGPNYVNSQCHEGSISGGQTTIDLGGGVTAQDYARVFIRGADGNYAALPLNAFTVGVEQGSPYLYIYGETPGSVATLTQKRGGNTIYEGQLPTDSTGFAVFMSSHDFLAGDSLTISVDDGTFAAIPLSSLTAQTDTSTNAVFGKAPANHYVEVRLTRMTPDLWWSWWSSTTASGSGNYRVEYNYDSYWGGQWRAPCLNVSVGDQCAVPRVSYYTTAGHLVSLVYDTPPPAPADNFESDNTPGTAKPHPGGTRSHTFHTTADMDWVSLSIPAWAVGRPVTIRAMNMGWSVAVDMLLYQTDGTTIVSGQIFQDFGDQQIIRWVPNASGTVLLRVLPMNESAAGHCDSFYDLRVDMASVSLPAILSK